MVLYYADLCLSADSRQCACVWKCIKWHKTPAAATDISLFNARALVLKFLLKKHNKKSLMTPLSVIKGQTHMDTHKLWHTCEWTLSQRPQMHFYHFNWMLKFDFLFILSPCRLDAAQLGFFSLSLLFSLVCFWKSKNMTCDLWPFVIRSTNKAINIEFMQS